MPTETTVNPQLKPLPKHIHGEFKQAQRRAMLLQKKIQELEEINNMEVDTSLYYNPDNEEKHYLRWLKLPHVKNDYKINGKRIKAYAFQSCWPEETDRMVFQFLYSKLGVRPRWWAYAEFKGAEISLRKDYPAVNNNCLPNINGLVYACHGDYGEKLHLGSKISKMKELYNYTSSPNLRENNHVTMLYSIVAKAYQYLEIDFKIRGEGVRTTLAELVLTYREQTSEKAFEVMREHQCYSCQRSDGDYCNGINYENGGEIFIEKRKLLAACNNHLDLAIKATEMFNDQELLNLTNRKIILDPCKSCVFGERSLEGSKELFKFLLDREPVLH